MEFTHQFHKVAGGRIFVRGAIATPASYSATPEEHARYAGALLFVGVVQLPKHATLEEMHSVRLNSSLWLDTEVARKPVTLMRSEEMCESDLGHLLTNIKYQRHTLPDSFEVFLRGTHLPDPTPESRWAYAAGVVPQRLAALPQDGLFEFNGSTDGFRLVSDDIFRGEALGSILRTPMWGPNGQYGLATSMEPETYPKWLAAERAKPPRAYDDPKFRAFVQLMEERAPSTFVYTVDTWSKRQGLASEVLAELMQAEAEVNTAGAAETLRSGPVVTADDATRAASLLQRRPRYR